MPDHDSVPANTALSHLPNFDPRTVPVLGIDTHLPALDPARLTPDALRARLANPPAWKPEIFIERKFEDRKPAHASVLIGIVTRERPTVLLTERTTHLSTHSGQVAFPGGKQDPSDTDAVDAALREAHEEIGLDRGMVEVLGQMPIYTTGTQFLVTPVVALVRPEHTVVPNPYEVADAFEVPLDFLLDPSHHRHHAINIGGVRRAWLSIPYMDGTQERFVWGATAAMLRNFYRMLSA